MSTIGVDQSLSNCALYGYRCLKNIKKLYQSAGKRDDQQQYKVIIVEATVSNPE